MGRVAIVTDSSVNMADGVAKEYGIHVVPLKVILGGQSFRDGIDITATNFYRVLATAQELPTTSQPSAGDFVEVYQRLGTEVDGIVSIHLSDLLSGTVKSALAARELVRDLPIEIIDSRSTSVGLGFVVLAAARAAGKGKALDDVVAAAREVVPKVNVLFVVDTLKYLHMGGRIGGASALLGTALRIKPLLELSEGQVNPVERVRSKERATNRMLEIMAQRVGSEGSGLDLRAAVVHAARPDEADRLRAQVLARFQPSEFHLSELTPAIGTHAGPGTLGLGWCVS